MKKRGPWFRKAPRLRVELLESRVTPSAIFELWAGTLTVAGSDNADWIQVRPHSFPPGHFDISVNNDAGSFALVDILRVHINAKGGNDNVFVADSFTIAVWISGGPGDDVIHGGSGNDLLDGDAGDDQIDGAAGDDVIQGGFGNDTILGGAGNDEIDGDVSDDSSTTTLPIGPTAVIAATTADVEATSPTSAVASDSADSAGTPGNDQIFGESGDDTIRGGDGNDVIIGGTGNDQLFGEGGDDTVDGGSGVDLIDGGAGADQLTGNPGEDIVHGDAADSGRPQVVLAPDAQPVNRPASPVQASDVDQLLASANDQLPVQSQQDGTGTGAAGNPEGPASTSQSTARFDGPFEIVTDTVGSQGGVGAGSSGQVGQESVGASDGGAVGVTENHANPYSTNPIAEQVDLLLNGALLTEATSDSPNQVDSGASKKERRRPTFLYIKPIPLPDLIPDITLPPHR